MPIPIWTFDDGRSVALNELTESELFAARCLAWDDDERFDPMQRSGGPGLTKWECYGALVEESDRRGKERFRALNQARQSRA